MGGCRWRSDEKFFFDPDEQADDLRVVPRSPLIEKDETLTRDDPVLQKGADSFYVKTYQLNLHTNRAYLLSLAGSGFDNLLALNFKGTEICHNRRYGNTTTRSRILFFPTESGVYDVQVTSSQPNQTGKFSLVVNETSNWGVLGRGITKDNTLKDSFSSFPYTVKLKGQRTYTIRLESEDTSKLDPFIRVSDWAGNIVAVNNDEDGNQGRLNSLVTFRTVSAGRYDVTVTSARPNQTGKYAIFLQD